MVKNDPSRKNPLDKDANTMKDVFVSHSQHDKETHIESLVVGLEAAGIECWYDTLELVPGDSLYDKINHGLTHSKIILLCLSEAFFEGHWAPKELKAALSLVDASESHQRVLPLLLCDPDHILQHFPLSIGDMLYIRWSEGIDNIVKKVKHALTEVDHLGVDYWAEEASTAYDAKNYERAALYAQKALEFDGDNDSAHILVIAALLHLGYFDSVLLRIYNHKEKWCDSTTTPPKVDIDIYDYSQDVITANIKGDEVNTYDFRKAVVGYLSCNLNPLLNPRPLAV